MASFKAKFPVLQELFVVTGRQGRRIRGFEGARAPPEHGSAPSHCQKHLLKMKGKLDETPFQTDIQQSYGGFDVHIIGLYMCKTAVIYHSALN